MPKEKLLLQNRGYNFRLTRRQYEKDYIESVTPVGDQPCLKLELTPTGCYISPQRETFDAPGEENGSAVLTLDFCTLTAPALRITCYFER